MTVLRSDARRNREKILAAASELFAQRGAEVCMGDIARMAGVGHATVFRRFPTKESLLLALLEQRVEALGAVAEEAMTHEDAFDGLRSAMAYMAESQARDRGFFEAVGTEFIGSDSLRAARDRALAAFAALLRRAQDTGQVRDDLEPQDVMFLISAAGHAGPCRIDLPGLSGRYLGVILDGMRPEGATPLAPPAPSLAEIDAALEALAEPDAAASSS
jgi:AcrR family transcriptional regulator